MFFKKPLQNITLQYILLFLLTGLSLWHFLSVPDAGVWTGVCLLVYLGSAVLLLMTVWHHKLAELRKYYPAILMLLLPQTVLASTGWQDLFVLFLLCAFYYSFLFSIYTKAYEPNSGISFGLLCGLLGYLYAPFVLLLLFIYALLISRRLVSVRTLLMPVVGLLIFVLYVCSFYYLFDYPLDDLVGRTQLQLKSMVFSPLNFPLIPLISCAVSLLLYIVVAYRMIRYLYKKNILLRKKCVILLFLSLYFWVLALFAPDSNHMPLLAFWSVLVMMLCEEEGFMKNRLFYNLMFFVLWVLGVVSCLL